MTLTLPPDVRELSVPRLGGLRPARTVQEQDELRVMLRAWIELEGRTATV